MIGNKIIVRVANADDLKYVQTIVCEINLSSKDPSTSILIRSPDLIALKIKQGNAVIAHTISGTWVGFSYIQSWSNDAFVSNCGLVVASAFRQKGVAGRIKKKIIALCSHKYPGASLFGLTTSLAVMKINSGLGYLPVTYSEITNETDFWKACGSCPDYNILQSRKGKNCLCTAMLLKNNA